MLLSDILATAGYAQGRATVTLLQALCGPSANNVLLSLGSLHRSCLWENIVLKTDETPETLATPREPHTVLPAAEAQSVLPSAEPSAASSRVATPLPATGAANGAQEAESSSPTPKPESSSSKAKDPKESNIRALKHLASQLPYALAPFYQCRICFSSSLYNGVDRNW